jgi:two-component system sensor kinase FixL
MMRLSATLPAMTITREAIVGLAYLAAYVLLDRVSLYESYAPLGTTPWNPSIGLSFVLILVFGRQFVALLFIAPLLADIANRHDSLVWPTEMLSVVAIGTNYSAALFSLSKRSICFDPALLSLRDVLLLILAATVSAAFVASCHVAIMIGAGVTPVGEFTTAFLRCWVADVVGILAVAPSIMIVLTRRRFLPFSIETVLQCAFTIGALILIFGIAEERKFQLFYVLLLPIVWMAVRNGLEGAAAGILLTQIGVILGVALFPDTRDELVALQCLMLVLTATGLVAGALVTERQRVETQLQLHRDSLARLAQFGSMVELAAAVAHEVNQPLMAAGTYARLVADAMTSSSGEATEVRELAHRTVAQINRAGEVMRRLRAMLRLDRSNRTAVPFVQIVTNTIALCEQDLKQSGVYVCVDIARGAPSVLVDILQIEQVLLNLIRNSIEAIRHKAQVGGTIVIEARRADDAFIEARITDSGPGFSREYLESGILSLSSSRAKGLGIGLPLSRSIIEAHRGRLWLDAASQRASVHFTLPIA